MRGKVASLLGLAFRSGITPAYAGKRDHEASGTADKRDHPRLCGEKLILICLLGIIQGSPPPMRGKAGDRNVFPLAIGITPAYAGKRYFFFWG